MSERASDPQTWDEDPDLTPTERRIMRDWTEEPFDLSLTRFDKGDDRTVDEWLAYIGRRTSWLSFAWACTYVFLTTPFMRGFRHALALALVLAFCLALLAFYFMIAMTVKR